MIAKIRPITKPKNKDKDKSFKGAKQTYWEKIGKQDFSEHDYYLDDRGHREKGIDLPLPKTIDGALSSPTKRKASDNLIFPEIQAIKNRSGMYDNDGDVTTEQKDKIIQNEAHDINWDSRGVEIKQEEEEKENEEWICEHFRTLSIVRSSCISLVMGFSGTLSCNIENNIVNEGKSENRDLSEKEILEASYSVPVTKSEEKQTIYAERKKREEADERKNAVVTKLTVEEFQKVDHSSSIDVISLLKKNSIVREQMIKLLSLAESIQIFLLAWTVFIDDPDVTLSCIILLRLAITSSTTLIKRRQVIDTLQSSQIKKLLKRTEYLYPKNKKIRLEVGTLTKLFYMEIIV